MGPAWLFPVAGPVVGLCHERELGHRIPRPTPWRWFSQKAKALPKEQGPLSLRNLHFYSLQEV